MTGKYVMNLYPDWFSSVVEETTVMCEMATDGSSRALSLFLALSRSLALARSLDFALSCRLPLFVPLSIRTPLFVPLSDLSVCWEGSFKSALTRLQSLAC